jgi:hypothetical protein
MIRSQSRQTHDNILPNIHTAFQNLLVKVLV